MLLGGFPRLVALLVLCVRIVCQVLQLSYCSCFNLYVLEMGEGLWLLKGGTCPGSVLCCCFYSAYGSRTPVATETLRLASCVCWSLGPSACPWLVAADLG